MGNIRVYELAKELKMESKQLLERLARLGVEVKGHSSSLAEEEAQRVKDLIKEELQRSIVEKRIQPTVIRRRIKKAKPQEVEAKVEEKVPEKKVVPKPAAPPAPPPPEPAPQELAPPEEKKKKEAEVSLKIEKKLKEEEDKDEKKPSRRRIIPEKRKTLKKGELWEDREPFHQVAARKRVTKRAFKKTEITVPKLIKRTIKFSDSIVLQEMAKRMGVKAGEVIKKLMDLGIMATINQSLDFPTASLLAKQYDYTLENVTFEEEKVLEAKQDESGESIPRPPVITIMGHVDHGKTSLLDAIRQTNVTEEEKGNITQHIGAYDVELEGGRIVFLDTPGHEAFTAMRARGAQVTDIVVLVVAADDGVMPQTIEAIDHAKAANVPVIVAINKMDKPTANADKIRRKLMDLGVVTESMGGETLCAEVCAKTKMGIDKLLELILLQAEMLELKADSLGLAKGIVVETELDKAQGPAATVLVQQGTLNVSDLVVSGMHYGRIRAMIDDEGRRVEAAGPSTPVKIYGLSGLPQAGDAINAVSDEGLARQVTEHRRSLKLKDSVLYRSSKVSLEDLYRQIQEGEVKELKLILKTDVQGSQEALQETLGKLSTKEIKINFIHAAVGAVSESNVMLAVASNAIIIGFNVGCDAKAHALAEKEQVDIRIYSVIYDAISDVKKAMEGFLEPVFEERMLGKAEVRELFNIHRLGVIAGSFILEGKVVKDSPARLIRDNEAIHEGRVSSLKRFKDDVKEVAAGYECGIGLENFSDIKVGDIIEAYELKKVSTQL
ncbi:MAG: translation initiation factor IF-2 [Deltaproteobacteria bacterium]|nr:MAG: translation initiation factor IF-2 [Deltaproteobacteria bacterium]